MWFYLQKAAYCESKSNWWIHQQLSDALSGSACPLVAESGQCMLTFKEHEENHSASFSLWCWQTVVGLYFNSDTFNVCYVYYIIYYIIFVMYIPILMPRSWLPLLLPSVSLGVQPFRGGVQWWGGWRWPHVALSRLLGLLPPAASSPAPHGQLCSRLPACQPRPVERGGSVTVYILATRLGDPHSKILIMNASGLCMLS